MPLELLSDTLIQLDIASLMTFRSVSQRAMQVVDSIPQFRTIVRHSLSSLRSIISVEAGPYITCQDLCRVIGDFRCEDCNDFAGYIYVLNCSRVCFLCFSKKDRYLPLTPSEACRAFGIDRRLAMASRKLKSVPGCYSPNEKASSTRLILIDPESARVAGIAFHGSALAMEQHVARVASEQSAKYRERLSRRADGEPGPSPRQPPRPAGVARSLTSFAKRFMAVVRAPSVASLEASTEWGFHCVGCERQYDRRPLHWRRKFTMDTFGDHLVQCGPILSDKHVLPQSSPPKEDLVG
jgi:hypothetical protein